MWIIRNDDCSPWVVGVSLKYGPLLTGEVFMNEQSSYNSISRDIEIVTDYLKSVGCSKIYLFGSAAAGDASESSDLDIAVRGIPALYTSCIQL